MSILAERRRKQRISIDPRNLHWKNDEAKFGKKMLEKMGWRIGQGLGKREQGRNENLNLKANYGGKGLGCNHSYDDTWIAHHDEFANLLASLNKKKEGINKSVPEKTKDAVEKSKMSRLRIRYKRFTYGSDLNEYSQEDRCAILGTKRRYHIEESISDESAPQEKWPKFDEGNIVHSSLPMNEYFAEKMRKLHQMKTLKDETTYEHIDSN